MGKAEPETEMSKPRFWRHGSHKFTVASGNDVKHHSEQLKLMTDKERRREKATELEMFRQSILKMLLYRSVAQCPLCIYSGDDRIYIQQNKLTVWLCKFTEVSRCLTSTKVKLNRTSFSNLTCEYIG